jgi:hypothetical protein
VVVVFAALSLVVVLLWQRSASYYFRDPSRH